MRRICGNSTIGQRMALDQCRHELGWDDVGNYYAHISRLTQLGNPEACFLTRIPMVFEETNRPRPCLDDLARVTDGRHNLIAYLVTILLYRHNGDARNDDTTRRYMRQVEGKEELQATAAGSDGEPTSRWLRNKGCVLCHHEAVAEVIRKTRWV